MEEAGEYDITIEQSSGFTLPLRGLLHPSGPGVAVGPG